MYGVGSFLHSAQGVAVNTCIPGVIVFQPVTSASWSNGWNGAAAAKNITAKVIYHSTLVEWKKS